MKKENEIIAFIEECKINVADIEQIYKSAFILANVIKNIKQEPHRNFIFHFFRNTVSTFTEEKDSVINSKGKK